MPFFAFGWSRKRLVHLPVGVGQRSKSRPSVQLRLGTLEERCTPAGTPVHDLTSGMNFATIQAAVTAAAANDVILIDAGTYAENVTINKALTLEGAKHGMNADTRFAAFVGGKADPTKEAILTTPTNNPLGVNPGANDLIRVEASGVTIDGLVIDGNNPALGNSTVTGFGNVPIHARRGITNIDSATDSPDPAGNLTVENNIIQNVSQRGVSLDGGGTVSTGNLITGNVIHDFGSDPTNGGFGVILFHDYYADVTNNTITDEVTVQTDIQLQGFDLSGTMTWSGNRLNVSQDGIGVDANVFSASAGVLNITNNTVNALAGVTGTDDQTWGIYVSNVTVGSTVNVTNNTVGSSGGQFARGVNLWDVPTTKTVTVSGGTITNSVTGVDLDSVDILSGASAAASTVNINNVAITGGTTGVLVRAATQPQIFPPPTTVDPTASVTANLTGNSIIGATTGVLVQGFSPTITATATLFRNTITGATTGVQVNANGLLGTGAQQTTQNIITGNTTGVAIAASAGAVQPIFNNNLSGNTGLAINNASGTLADASVNWFGVNTAAGVAAKVSANVDYSPFLDSGTNTQPMGTPGFNGDFTVLDVAAASPQAGNLGQIQEGVNDVTAGGTVNVTAGTYAENVTINKNLTLAGAAGNPQTSIIQAAGGTGVAISAPATTVTVKGLKITGAVNGVTASGQANLNLADLLLTGNTTSGGSVSNIGTLNYTPDSTTTTGTSVTITTTTFQRGADQAVSFSGVTTFIVNGSPGPDTFDITPNATTTFAIHGNAPTPAGPRPGDSLVIQQAGTTSPTLTSTFDPATGFSGSETFGNRMPVLFDGIETLNGTPAPAVGPPIDFSIALNGTVIEHNLAYDPAAAPDAKDMHFREISSGNFLALATTRNPTTGAATVFGILADHTLWEHDLSFDAAAPQSGLDVHWRKISNGFFTSITAAWDSTGAVPGAVVFGVVQGRTLFEHDLNFDSALSAELTDVHWRKISNGVFTSISATQEPAGAAKGSPVVFGVVQSGNLWEHDLNFDAAAAPEAIDVHWREISSNVFTTISATQDATGVSGPVVFGALQAGGLMEHDLNFDPAASPETIDVHWRKISSGVFTSISAAQDFTGANKGAPAVYGVVQNGNLWEHDLNFDPASPPETTDLHWREISSGLFASISAATDFTGTSAGAPALFGVLQNDQLWESDLNFDPASPNGALDLHLRMLSSSLFQSTSAV